MHYYVINVNVLSLQCSLVIQRLLADAVDFLRIVLLLEYFHLEYLPLGYRISSFIRRSLTNAWCKATVYEINAGSLTNTGGLAQYPRSTIAPGTNGDKEKSAHCNN